MIEGIVHFAHEQDFIKDSYFGSKRYKDIISLYPHKKFNSYDYTGYNGQYKPYDIDGKYCQWKHRDFMIHYPGLHIDRRIFLANKYLPKVIL